MKNGSMTLIGGSLSGLILPGPASEQVNALAVADGSLVVRTEVDWDTVVDLGPEGALFDFTTHTFTNAGATGAIGPNLTQVRNAYTGIQWAQSERFLSVYGVGMQVFTVPETGLYTVKARGGTRSVPGSTLFAMYEISVTVMLEKGWQLYIAVGQMGEYKLLSTNNYASGGGGGTFVYCPQFDAEQPILVAGGGAGSSIASYGPYSAAIGTQGSLPTAGRFMNTSNGASNATATPGKSASGSIAGSNYGAGGGGGLNPNLNESIVSQYGIGRSLFVDGALTERSLEGGGFTSISYTYPRGGFGGGGAAACTSGAYRAAGGGGGYTGGDHSYQTNTGYTAAGGGGGHFYHHRQSDLKTTQFQTSTPQHGYCTLTRAG